MRIAAFTLLASSALCAPALAGSSDAALTMGGAFSGPFPQRFRDLSGVGAGPWVTETIIVDQNGAATSAAGGQAAASSNASDAVAASSANSQALTFPYLWNGATFDRWRGDATHGAWVNVTMLPPLAAGSNVIGSVGLTGALPPFASTPTVNLGALNGAASAANQLAVQSAPGASAPTALGVQGVTGGAPLAVAQPNLTKTGALANAGDVVSLALADAATIGLQLSSGWTGGPVVAEASMDGGLTYPVALNLQPYVGGTPVASFTAGGNWEASPGGLTNMRLRATGAITGGPITVNLVATTGGKSIRVGAPASNPVNVSDANNAAFASAAAMTAGTTYAAGRSVGAKLHDSGRDHADAWRRRLDRAARRPWAGRPSPSPPPPSPSRAARLAPSTTSAEHAHDPALPLHLGRFGASRRDQSRSRAAAERVRHRPPQAL